MRKTEMVRKETEELVDIICNKCGESIKVFCHSHIPRYNYGGIEGAIAFGVYGSNYLEDGTDYTFAMCERCTKELFDSFKIPPDEDYYR
jgi:hypothetical protein